jgi:hypothetical protein
VSEVRAQNLTRAQNDILLAVRAGEGAQSMCGERFDELAVAVQSVGNEKRHGAELFKLNRFKKNKVQYLCAVTIYWIT